MTLAFTGQKIGIGIPPLSLTTIVVFFPFFGGHETWGELEVMDVRGQFFPSLLKVQLLMVTPVKFGSPSPQGYHCGQQRLPKRKVLLKTPQSTHRSL